ncbi:HIT family protein [Candidatus Nitrotoga sp. 1052]|uniref:HIT family protein n=1 Tax=Candidatus Nitrotoga sp. 1052 TaxID=2886964 RepID=UPI001EF6F335|nr:HIT family protein [Candidatus Nitrotoga sp. 1052]
MMNCELCKTTSETLLWRGELCRVVLIEDADYPGFCRVIWNRHVKEMTDLNDGERHAFMDAVFAVESALREVMQPDKINLASLGNLTPHLHWHIIPRYALDKHFPNPVWGTPQRAGFPKPPLDWQARLSQSIRQRLQ